MIATVIRLANDMVLVFDENGDELPEYQGWYDDVRHHLLITRTADTVFKHWFGNAIVPTVVGAVEW